METSHVRRPLARGPSFNFNLKQEFCQSSDKNNQTSLSQRFRTAKVKLLSRGYWRRLKHIT